MDSVSLDSSFNLPVSSFTELNLGPFHFQAFADKALFWPKHEALFIADLHLGKADVYQQAGLNVPRGQGVNDLTRLSRLIHQTQAKELIILGDFCHAKRGLTPAIEQEWLTWKTEINSSMTVILGNHDKGTRSILERWEIYCEEEGFHYHGLELNHEPREQLKSKAAWSLCGHVHPVVRLQDGKEVLRLACFAERFHQLILPSFGDFTGGYRLEPADLDAVYVIADQQVIEL